MAHTLEILDHKITKLNLCLECDYRREITCPPYYLKVCEQVHWCEKLARAASHLEHLSYTGRVCHSFFDILARHTDPRTTRLKTIDITVKNCCRQNAQWNESGSGITDMHFIGAFEQLVLSGIRALERLKTVDLLRIRYVDLGMYYLLAFVFVSCLLIVPHRLTGPTIESLFPGARWVVLGRLE
jgi:hypothetical protein